MATADRPRIANSAWQTQVCIGSTKLEGKWAKQSPTCARRIVIARSVCPLHRALQVTRRTAIVTLHSDQLPRK